MSYLYLREHPTKTLAEVRESVEADRDIVTQISNRDVRVDLVENQTIALGEIEVPASTEAIKALGAWLDVPAPFLTRINADDPELAQTVLSRRLDRSPGTGAFVYTMEGGLREVRDPNQRVIPIQRLLETAGRVVAPEARVLDFEATGEEFRLDIIVPENFDRGIGGDPQVGDLSAAGIRIGQNRKQNLSPWVQPFQYRLRCTNGMSGSNDGLKMDARGSSVEEVLAQFEALANQAFSRVEEEMAAFYALRDERVDNAERDLLRLGQEAGLSARAISRLQERVPLMEQGIREEEGRDHLTRFDLVNLITNQANDPRNRRRGNRDVLENIGGSIVSEHASRCAACSSRIVH